MTFISDKIIDTEVSYRVEVTHDDGATWTDMPGFAKDTEDEAREGTKVLQPLCDDVRLFKVTTVVGVRREELEL